MTEKQADEIRYYRARAADMMAKAQAAPSKTIRVAYLNLAWAWTRKAANLEKEWLESQATDGGTEADAMGAEQKDHDRSQA